MINIWETKFRPLELKRHEKARKNWNSKNHPDKLMIDIRGGAHEYLIFQQANSQ